MNYWERLKKLKIMSLQRRRERYIIIHMWKTLHGSCPNDINVQFSPPSRHGVRAKVPILSSASTQRHQTTYDASFAVHGPRLWNTIPNNLTVEPSFQKFKQGLTTFILTVPETPPVPGYTGVNRNSLRDWNMNKTSWSAHPMGCR